MTNLDREFGPWARHVGPAIRRELESLASERNPELRGEALLGLGLRLERSGDMESAAQLYQSLNAPELGPATGRRAQERLHAILGQGNALPRAEFLARSLAQQASDPAAIFAMGAAGAVFRMTRLAALSRLAMTPGTSVLTRGFCAQLFAGTAGFLLEAPSFTLASRSAHALLGREQDWSGQALWREFAGGALTLLGLKVFGGLSGLALQRWGRGSGFATGALRVLLPQAGMLGGIVLSRRLEEGLGLRERRDGATEVTDALATLFQFHSGGRLAQEAFGASWQARERDMDSQSEALLRIPRPEIASVTAPRLALAGAGESFPPWLSAMMAGDGSSPPSRRASPPSQLHLPFAEDEIAARRPFLSQDLRAAAEVDGTDTAALRSTLDRLGRGPRPLSARDQIHWLREFGFAGGIPILGEMFRASTEHSNAALEALKSFAATQRAAVVSELRQSLRQNDVLTFHAALRTLVDLRATEALEDLRARRATKGPIGILGETARIDLGDTSLAPFLRARGMKWQDSVLDRIAAWEGLGRLEDPETAIVELRQFFRYSRPVYFRAGLALARLGAEAAIPNPAEMIHSANSLERSYLAEAFWAKGRREAAVELWRGNLGCGDLKLRSESLNLIAEHRLFELRPELRRLRNDFQPEIRRRAVEILIDLARESQDSVELEAILESSDSHSIQNTEALQTQAAVALLSFDAAPAARERLETYLQSSFTEHRLQAAEAVLAQGPHPRARETLEALQLAPEARIRYRAAALLARPPSRSGGNLSGIPAATALGLGIGLSFLLGAAPAHASVLGATSSGDVSTYGFWGLLAAGGIAMAAMRGSRSEPPESRESDHPPRPNLLAWFDSPVEGEERVFLETPPENAISVLGRETVARANIFPGHYRNISRRHMDLRVHDGQVEARIHNGSGGLRINGRNLAPFQWYQLRDRDVVEFVTEGGMDMLASVPSEEEPGEQVSVVHRLGRKPAEATDVPAVFVFRLPRPPPIPIPAPSPLNFLGRVADFFRARAASERPPPPAAEATRDSQPVAAFTDPEEVFADIHRLSSELSTPLPLLEAALRAPDWTDPDVERGRPARRDVLTALTRIHRRLCGNAEQVVPIRAQSSDVARPSLQSIRVPQWDGVLRQRLDTFRQGLDLIQRTRGNTLQMEPARQELGHITDRLNRLFELVRLFRKNFHEPEEIARFEAIEAAYRGLRPEVRAEGHRVRSDTRGLDVTVRRRQRDVWIEEFSQPGRASRAVLNMRILMGEVSEAHGIPIAGNLYASLSSSTIYEGNRSVRVYFDASNGMIVAFEDGTDAAERTVRIHQDQNRRILEAMISIDSQTSGRIADVAVLGEVRDSIRAALVELRGLRVLPPQVISGSTGFLGDPDRQTLQIHLVPDLHTPASQWHRVIGLARNALPDWSLVTLEPTHPDPGQIAVQLWVPSMEILDMSLGDPVTIHRDSQ